MINIPEYLPPPSYNFDVKIPGSKFLRATPHPTSVQWKKHTYWKRIHTELYTYYNGICSYSSTWTPRPSPQSLDHTSVDHFIPKSLNPQLAYEWKNFRLCRAKLNNNKEDNLIIDPFTVGEAWFVIDFSTFLIRPNSLLGHDIQTDIQNTINILQLNTDNALVDQRIEAIKYYSLDLITRVDLQERYPFLAYEIDRQNFDANFKTDLKAIFTAINP